MRPCVFFDRDGIVNRPPPEGAYVRSWREFELLPEFVDILRTAVAAGYAAVIVTNQRGIARGVVNREDVEDIHARLREQLRERPGLELLDILYCPHDEGQCECRKPQPGMLLEAARRHGIDLAESWMIGDSERDVEAGRAAGCRTIRVAAAGRPTRADVRVGSMSELKETIGDLLRSRKHPA